jgi:hypothetical protein
VGRYLVHRSDGNQADMDDAVIKAGGSVLKLGQPLDRLYGYRGVNYLIEGKTARGKMREGQIDFITSWKGQAAVCRSVADLLIVIGAIGKVGNEAEKANGEGVEHEAGKVSGRQQRIRQAVARVRESIRLREETEGATFAAIARNGASQKRAARRVLRGDQGDPG